MANSVDGLSQLISKFEKMRKVDVSEQIKDGGVLIKNTAQNTVRVDTGRLKGDIREHYDKDTETSTVYTTVNYAPYLEFGTRFMRAYPFLLPAFNKNIKFIKDSIKSAIKRQLKSISNGRA